MLLNHSFTVCERMARVLSPLSSASVLPAVASYGSRKRRGSAVFHFQKSSQFNSVSTISFSSASPSPGNHFKLLQFRKSFQVRAKILQDEEEKVVVEESFRLKDDGGTLLENPTTSGVDGWIVKLEQSVNIFLTDSVIKVLDSLYHDRHYPRFFVLENIARVPYFAFISVLHLYESFGWWRRADYLKVHFAESWNEMHHLLIMEAVFQFKIMSSTNCFSLKDYNNLLQELGGNAWWFDRLLAQSIAFVYYFVTVAMYIISPRMAYHFSECVEHHAYETYDKYLKAYGDELKNLPAPEIAVTYYTGGDLYLFDEFQTSRQPCSRRPKIENLYDVFLNIRDDEAEHCKTMKACQTPGNLRSPHSSLETDEDQSSRLLPEDSEGIVDRIKESVTSP